MDITHWGRGPESGRHFADNILKYFVNSVNILFKCVSRGSIDKKSTLD